MDQVYPSNRYGRYCVPDGLERRPAVRAVRQGRVYEPHTIAFMRAHAGEGDVIHAGTFFGDFLPGVSAALASDAILWAFEPNPGSHACATETIALNSLGNVRLTHAALSDRDGAILFRTHNEKGAPLGGLSHFTEKPGDGVTEVPATSLDKVIPPDRNITILQLDVEGHEQHVLSGAGEIISRCKPIVILEYGDPLGEWISQRFPDLGYRRQGRLHGNTVYATSEVDLGPQRRRGNPPAGGIAASVTPPPSASAAGGLFVGLLREEEAWRPQARLINRRINSRITAPMVA